MMFNMSQTIQRAKRIGGSLMVRIPKEIVEIESIHEGEAVQIEIKKVRKDWFGAIKGIGPFNKETDRAHSKYE